MNGRPISEAPRDGTDIIAETTHHELIMLSFQKHGGIMGNLSGWNELAVMDSIIDDKFLVQWWPANTPKDQIEKTPPVINHSPSTK